MKRETIITEKDRICAQVALAAIKDTAESCPDFEEFALLIDGRLSETRQEELWNHLALCPVCYEQWRIISELQPAAVKKRSLAKIISIGGGFLAAAASVMLFINVQHSSVPEQVSMDSPPLLCFDSVEKEDTDTVPEMAAEALLLESMAPSTSEHRQPVEQKMRKKERAVKSMAPSPVQSASPRVLKSVPKQYGAAGAENSFNEDSFAALDQKGTAGETLLDINRVIPTLLQKLKKAAVGEVIEVKTYKRDRGFRLEKRPDDEVFIQEYGFNSQELVVPMAKLKKTLKTIIKTEFPRSNRVWLRTEQPGTEK